MATARSRIDPNVMTPEVVGEVQPLTINNPYVPAKKTDSPPPVVDTNSDRAASVTRTVEPLVIVNPYVTQRGTVAHND